MKSTRYVATPVIDQLPGQGAYTEITVGRGTYRPVGLQLGYGSCYLRERLYDGDKGISVLMMREEAIEVAQRILTFYRVPFCNRVSNESE